MTDRSDDDVAARLVTEAGQLLLSVRDELAHATADERKAAGDKRSHEFLMRALAQQRPADAVLSEEGDDDHVRLSAKRVKERPQRCKKLRSKRYARLVAKRLLLMKQT